LNYLIEEASGKSELTGIYSEYVGWVERLSGGIGRWGYELIGTKL
jgi:hypothetical protein